MLCSFPYVHSAGEVLWGIANCHDDLTRYLEAWREGLIAPAMRHLGKFLYEHSNSLYLKGKVYGGWPGRQTQAKQVILWLLDPKTVQIAERAFFAYQDAPFAEELAAAADHLEAIQRRLHTSPYA